MHTCRPQYFKLLDQCVSQIVLHKNGIDPDFNYTKKFDVEVDPLIGTFDLRRKRVGCVADSGYGAGGLGGVVDILGFSIVTPTLTTHL